MADSNALLKSCWKWISSVTRIVYYAFEAVFLALLPEHLRYKDISDEIALITGAGNGIGRELALEFGAKVSKLVLWDIDEKSLKETSEMVKTVATCQVHTYECDVSDSNAVYSTAARVRQEVGQVSILINNAGIGYTRNFLDIKDDEVRRTFNVNILAHIWTCKAFLGDMMASKRGHIVSLASAGGIIGLHRLVDYSASKFAAVGLMEALRQELALGGYQDIHLTIVAPFFVGTRLFTKLDTINGIQSPSQVAKQTLSAVRANKEFIFVPYRPLSLAMMFPMKIRDKCYRLYGTEKIIDSCK